MNIEVPIRATVNINGQKLICIENESRVCAKCALKDCYCFGVRCDATDRSDGKNIYFEPYTGVLFDKRDVIITLPEI